MYSPPETPEIAARLIQRGDDTEEKVNFHNIHPNWNGCQHEYEFQFGKHNFEVAITLVPDLQSLVFDLNAKISYLIILSLQVKLRLETYYSNVQSVLDVYKPVTKVVSFDLLLRFESFFYDDLCFPSRKSNGILNDTANCSRWMGTALKPKYSPTSKTWLRNFKERQRRPLHNLPLEVFDSRFRIFNYGLSRRFLSRQPPILGFTF